MKIENEHWTIFFIWKQKRGWVLGAMDDVFKYGIETRQLTNVCRYEKDMKNILDAMGSDYPYHYSFIHHDVDELTPKEGYIDVSTPPCSKDTVIALAKCALTKCLGLIGNAMFVCLAQNCIEQTASLSQECITCAVVRWDVQGLKFICISPVNVSRAGLDIYNSSFGASRTELENCDSPVDVSMAGLDIYNSSFGASRTELENCDSPVDVSMAGLDIYNSYFGASRTELENCDSPVDVSMAGLGQNLTIPKTLLM